MVSILLSFFIFVASVTDRFFRGQGFQMTAERLLRKPNVIFKAAQKIQLLLTSAEAVSGSVAVRSNSSSGEASTRVYTGTFDHLPCVYF